MKTQLNKIAFLLTLAVVAPGCAATDSAQGASNMIKGSGQVAVGSVKAVASVAAVPMVIVGSVAQGSKKSGESMIEWATGEEPLPIGKKTATVGPSPKQALNDKDKSL